MSALRKCNTYSHINVLQDKAWHYIMGAIFYLFHKSSKTKWVYSLHSKNKITFLPKYKRINFKSFSLRSSGNYIRGKEEIYKFPSEGLWEIRKTFSSETKKELWGRWVGISGFRGENGWKIHNLATCWSSQVSWRKKAGNFVSPAFWKCAPWCCFQGFKVLKGWESWL